MIFDDWLGIPCELSHCVQEGLVLSLLNQTGTLHLPDTFFAQMSGSSEAWLSKTSLPSANISNWDSRQLSLDILLTNPVIPVLFGTKEARLKKNNGSHDSRIDLPIDIFGSAFFMLSRYEEVVLSERDTHDRFPGSASIAHKFGFLERPIIDEYVEILWSAMKQLWPGLTRKPRKNRFLVSCDVDSPFLCKGSFYQIARRAAGDLLKRRSPGIAWANLKNEFQGYFGDLSHDPHYQGIQYIMSLNERAGRKVAFYFIPQKTSALDGSPSLDDPNIRALLREINHRGHEIGIHPGYNTYRHPENMTRSVEVLRRVLDEANIMQSELGGRQHYLRWETAKTARLLADNGLSYDSTLSYADRPGFRCGTSREFKMFDPAAREPLPLLQRPLVLMECSVIADRYLGLGYTSEAIDLMLTLKRRALSIGGEFTLLWHNSHFTMPEDKEFYRQLVTH